MTGFDGKWREKIIAPSGQLFFRLYHAVVPNCLLGPRGDYRCCFSTIARTALPTYLADNAHRFEEVSECAPTVSLHYCAVTNFMSCGMHGERRKQRKKQKGIERRSGLTLTPTCDKPPLYVVWTTTRPVRTIYAK